MLSLGRLLRLDDIWFELCDDACAWGTYCGNAGVVQAMVYAAKNRRCVRRLSRCVLD